MFEVARERDRSRERSLLQHGVKMHCVRQAFVLSSAKKFIKKIAVKINQILCRMGPRRFLDENETSSVTSIYLKHISR